jgi:hypothetical protein
MSGKTTVHWSMIRGIISSYTITTVYKIGMMSKIIKFECIVKFRTLKIQAEMIRYVYSVCCEVGLWKNSAVPSGSRM